MFTINSTTLFDRYPELQGDEIDVSIAIVSDAKTDISVLFDDEDIPTEEIRSDNASTTIASATASISSSRNEDQDGSDDANPNQANSLTLRICLIRL